MMDSQPVVAETLADQTLRQDPNDLAAAATLSAPRSPPPAQIPGYDIQRCLGEGAFGSIWLATEQNTGKQVAIKFYTHRRGLDWSLLNREVEKLAVLYTCRDIIGLLQVGWDADPPYYVMEYLLNGSLASLLEQGPLGVSESVRIGTAVTQALVHAHKSGILHCDLKPANVLLDAELAPRLADFGQSRLSHEQNPALGTLFYMAPEQADLNAIPDARWDVYALGALFFHMLTGEAPYRTPEHEHEIQSARSLDERLTRYRQIIETSPRPQKHRQVTGVDSQLADIVDRCLEVQPGRRYPHAQAVLDALEQRSRHRSRRPLMTLLIVLPTLLLLALGPLVNRAMNSAVNLAQRNLAARAVESDAVTARILAVAIEDGLDQRRQKLLDVAEDDQVQYALTQASDTPEDSPEWKQLQTLLNRIKGRTDESLRDQHSALDNSWFLVDAAGFQRWRDPPSPTINRNFSWRDYFHGQGKDFAPDQLPAGMNPIQKAHFTPAYRGTTGGTYKVAISVPVWDLEHHKVIGVLARTIPLGQLLNEYQSLIRGEDVDRIIALVDVRSWKLLDHRWMTNARLSELSNDTFEQLSIEDPQRSQLARLDKLVIGGQPLNGEDRDLLYVDPVGKFDPEYSEPWLAAFWPVRHTSWIAIVQEQRSAALQPVREIHDRLVRYAVIGLIVCCAVVAALWFFVMRSMTRRNRPRRRHGAVGGLPASATASTITE